MAGEKQHSDSRPSGQLFGVSGTDLIGFYGKSPVARPATIATGTDLTTSIASIVSIVAAMQTLGLIASS